MKIIVISATLVDSKAKSFTSSLVAYDGHSFPFLTSNPKIEELYKKTEVFHYHWIFLRNFF